jgi:hypothetical protein
VRRAAIVSIALPLCQVSTQGVRFQHAISVGNLRAPDSAPPARSGATPQAPRPILPSVGDSQHGSAMRRRIASLHAKNNTASTQFSTFRDAAHGHTGISSASARPASRSTGARRVHHLIQQGSANSGRGEHLGGEGRHDNCFLSGHPRPLGFSLSGRRERIGACSGRHRC